MTLVLAAANSDQIVMLADRRLTSNGAVAEEEAGKLCAYILGGARFAVGFAGLARVGQFDMRSWLLDALHDSAEPNLIQSFPTLTRFRERVSQDFATLPALRSLRPSDKRTEFVFVGFLNSSEHPVLATALVSNCRDTARQKVTPTSWDEFALSAGREELPRRAEPVLIAWAGAARAIKERDVEALHGLLTQRRPHQAIVGMATEIMIEAAKRPEASGTVGTRIVWVRIPSARSEAIQMGYYSAQPSFDTYVPDCVVRTPTGSGGHAFVSLQNVSRERPSVIPRVHRHAPCPCKSGKRYKSCHGRKARTK